MTLMRSNWPGSLASMVGAGASVTSPCKAFGMRGWAVLVLVRRVRRVAVAEDFAEEVVFDFEGLEAVETLVVLAA